MAADQCNLAGSFDADSTWADVGALNGSSPALTGSEVARSGMAVATTAASGFFMAVLPVVISAYAHIVTKK
jgi:hypothetical protein